MRDELVVHYQPILHRFADGSWDVTAVEALLRWHHPRRGVLTPDAIGFSEDQGADGALELYER